MYCRGARASRLCLPPAPQHYFLCVCAAADTGNHAIRKISGNSVALYLGTAGTPGGGGDGGPRLSATLRGPRGVTVDQSTQDMYISGACALRRPIMCLVCCTRTQYASEAGGGTSKTEAENASP
eukprot:354399-Chlamydomonas_euryale.AAC.3